jgi:hypothetical protein
MGDILDWLDDLECERTDPDNANSHLIVRAPATPGLAVPGYYMLFVVSDEGVPSEARLIHLDE